MNVDRRYNSKLYYKNLSNLLCIKKNSPMVDCLCDPNDEQKIIFDKKEIDLILG